MKLKGTLENDFLVGSTGKDKIDGLAGDDLIFGLAGDDDLDGDNGDDALFGEAGDDRLDGGDGADFLDGGDGDDQLKGGDGSDTLDGGSGDDRLDGGKDDDVLSGGDGDDQLKGGDGSDTLDGGSGDDRLDGGKDDDVLSGGDGDDQLKGGDGADTLDGGAGSDVIDGGDGADVMIYTLGQNVGESDEYIGGDGADRLTLDLTSVEWQDPELAADITAYFQFVADNADPVTGEGNGAEYTFSTFGLTVSTFELSVLLVDGVEVDPLDNPVVAADDYATLSEDEVLPIIGSVLDNDSLPDGLDSVTLVTGPAMGDLTLNPDGTWSYLLDTTNPAVQALEDGESYIDTFVYRATDSDGDWADATVSIEIVGSDDLAPPPENFGVRFDGAASLDYSGISVASAGDVNGDGVADLLIGANGADPNGSGSGAAYVVYGVWGGLPLQLALSALTAPTGSILTGAAAGDAAGGAVSGVGDINGDGYHDFAVGAEFADPAGANSGAAYAIFGGPTGLPSSVDLGSLDGTQGFAITGAAQGDNLGSAVSGAGDMNGDGIDDLIVGANFADPSGMANAGQAYVIYGSDQGFAPSLDVAPLDGTNGFAVEGAAAGDNAGISVAGVIDFNGDGVSDLIVGAAYADPGGNSAAGQVHVVFGSASLPANVSLGALDGTNGLTIEGIVPGDSAGLSVADAGDVNGDGIGDIIIGASYASPGNVLSGQSYVVYGTSAGHGASIDLGALDGTQGFAMDGVDAGDFSGVSVAGAGDVNGDGYDDVLVGAYRASPSGTYSGETYLVFGGPPGTGQVDLAGLDGSNGYVLAGIDAFDFSGFSAAGAGDVNGDDVEDFLIGASFASPNGTRSGETYLVYGGSDVLAGFDAADGTADGTIHMDHLTDPFFA